MTDHMSASGYSHTLPIRPSSDSVAASMSIVFISLVVAMVNCVLVTSMAPGTKTTHKGHNKRGVGSARTDQNYPARVLCTICGCD